MNLKILDTSRSTEWDRIVRTCAHDFYHLSSYHRLAEDRGEGRAQLIVFSDESALICLPIVMREISSIDGLEDSSGIDITSVYGYSGPLANHENMAIRHIDEFKANVADYFRDLEVCSVFSRLHPLLDQERILYGLGDMRSLGATVSIDLELSPEEQWAAYRKGHKYDIKKLRRESYVCVRDDNLEYLDQFIQIYTETMDRRNAAKHLYFDRAYFDSFFSMKNAECKLIVCLKELEVASAAIFVHCAGIVQYHLSGSRAERTQNSPTKMILDEARKWAGEIGAKIFHLGGGAGSQEDSLFAFKSGFSKRRHSFETWRWICDKEMYRSLVNQRHKFVESNGTSWVSSDFFPSYRTPGIAG